MQNRIEVNRRISKRVKSYYWSEWIAVNTFIINNGLIAVDSFHNSTCSLNGYTFHLIKIAVIGHTNWHGNDNIVVYFSAGQNLWVDHVTFVGHSDYNKASDGQPDYDKFLASSEAGKMSLFDKVYDDIAMNQGQDDSQMAQNRFEALLNLAKGNGNIQDFMSMFLNKYGDGSSLGSSGDFLADLIGTMIAGFMNMVDMFDESDEDKVKQLHEMLDARMSNEDQAKVDKMKRDGVDPGQAKMLSQANTEAGLTANDQQQSQQQQITMRG